MITAYTAAQIRAAERVAIDRDGDATLMRRASTAVASVVAERLPHPLPGRSAVLLVGAGNNGGDALWAGAFLRRRGLAVTALLLQPDRAHPAGLAALRRAGGRVLALDPGDPAPAPVRALLTSADAVIDGIVGLAARPPLRPGAAALVAAANTSPALKVAVDLPSGIDPDTGATGPADDGDPVVFAADVTVTFGGVKTGLLLAADAMVSVGIGMEPDPGPAPDGTGSAERFAAAAAAVDAIALTDADLRVLLPDPGAGADKFTDGLVGIVAGSPGYPGAAVLCTGGAVRTRPGMVRYAGAQATAVVARWPEVVAAADPSVAGRVQAWVIGPGMGTDAAAGELLADVLRRDEPVLVDADGLTLLGEHPQWLSERTARGAVTLLTPHDREFTRVFPDLPLDDRLTATRTAARRSGATVLLKGHRTIVADPHGTTVVNRSGSSWLATAGSGDVLSGVIGSLLAAGLPPVLAAGAGAFLHGRAGERVHAAGEAGAQALWSHLRAARV
ncbi:NAD(P)H-hydrate dehydratase [Nakamurella flava]|uniref:Bifunctional NAD(P)H-hydrate repair enzyme n=1 Tax=Nakamurella flava TaxID=2576308 RepID=A0A4U6QFG3_9ACTN|nr:NAD(P)H-hydrate dehydratase [Nakamurella flava]TKV58729.1 NAD(P)H-hydrate dehydratase [Nakamurella flava]